MALFVDIDYWSGEYAASSTTHHCADGFAVSDDSEQFLDRAFVQNGYVDVDADTYGTCLHFVLANSPLAFSEWIGKGFGLSVTQALAVIESKVAKVGTLSKGESISVLEQYARQFVMSKDESLGLVDLRSRGPNLVFSDMVVSAGDFSDQDFIEFMTHGNSPGYEKWRDFIPGDYEYSKAMIRVVIESKNDDRGLLTTLEAAIDVPDMIDRGSATVTDSAGLYVPFGRNFHIPPEVTIVARGGLGNPTVPEFDGSPTKLGFNVRLRDTITGLYVTGSFTWVAAGY